MNPDLLQPSVDRQAVARPLYSTTALFAPAFFGGPAAAAVIFALNAQRAGRVGTDAWLIAAGFLLALAAPWAILHFVADPAQWARYIVRALGIGLAAVYYLRHRALYRTQELFGLASPSGWLAGFAALGVALGLSMATAWWLSTR
jgi:hypothetical protein